MDVFEVVKENVTARQAAEAYGLKVGRTGMACCPFHSDKSPSMKLDERYYCFGCGATGDAVDLTAKIFGIGLREAAVKLAEDFGLNYDSRQKPSVRPRIREPTPEQKYQKEENHCYKVLTDYFHLLREWEKKYAPKRNGEVSVHYVDSIGFKDLQGFLDKQPERPSVLQTLKEKCDAPECNPAVCRKARDAHEL